MTTTLRGPELVYLVGMGRGIANFGVVITKRAKGSKVEPRVVADFDENRLTGYAALPVNHNPYMDAFLRPVLAAGALSPAPGPYAIVFDSATQAGAGGFTFRFWVNDVTAPTLRLRTKIVRTGQDVKVGAVDKGSGIYSDSIAATVDGEVTRASYRNGVVSISTRTSGSAASAAPAGLGRAGVEEHRERRAHPPEHALAHCHVPGSLVGAADRRPATQADPPCPAEKHGGAPLPGGVQPTRTPSAPRRIRASVRRRTRRYFWRSRSSIVGSASRSLWTERMNSSFSSSGVMTLNCFFRRCRSRSRRAAEPKRRSRRGLSTAIARSAARTSNTSHGQLTVSV